MYWPLDIDCLLTDCIVSLIPFDATLRSNRVRRQKHQIHFHDLPLNDPSTSQRTQVHYADKRRYEYSWIYRDSPSSLSSSAASYGVWLAELATNLRAAMGGDSPLLYRHNVAHDGSLSRLLSVLQIDQMVWPGMGSEVAFELYSRQADGCWYIRVLWKGQPLRSSNPSLGLLDLIPVANLLKYIDGLVGVNASKVPNLCRTSSS